MTSPASVGRGGTDAPGRPEALLWDTGACPVAAAVAVVGDRSTFLVLREVFSGVRRFDDMRARTGMSRQVLAVRLGKLVRAGLLRRHAYQDPGQRRRQEYRLTDKGFDLYPVLVSLLEWGVRYASGPDGPGTEARHRDCGAHVRPRLVCDDGHPVQRMRDVLLGPGPGARRLDAGEVAARDEPRATEGAGGDPAGSAALR